MKNVLKILTLAGGGFFLFARSASAALFDIWAGTGSQGGSTCNIDPRGCSFCDGIKVAVNIVNDLTTVAIVITVGMVVYGAIRMMVSAGSESNLKEAKGAITSAVIGLVVVLCGWLIVNTFIHILADPGNPFPWANIQCQNL